MVDRWPEVSSFELRSIDCAFLPDLIQRYDPYCPVVGWHRDLEGLLGHRGLQHPEQRHGDFHGLERFPPVQVALQDREGLGHDVGEDPLFNGLKNACLLGVGEALSKLRHGHSIFLGNFRQGHPHDLVRFHQPIAGLFDSLGVFSQLALKKGGRPRPYRIFPCGSLPTAGLESYRHPVPGAKTTLAEAFADVKGLAQIVLKQGGRGAMEKRNPEAFQALQRPLLGLGRRKWAENRSKTLGKTPSDPLRGAKV
jgi:hypothetical protein